MATKPRKTPPPHTGQRRPTSEFIQPPACYAVQVTSIDAAFLDAVVACLIYDPVTGDSTSWADGLDPVPDVPNGFILLENGEEVDISYEYEIVGASLMLIRFSDMPLVNGATYHVATRSPVTWLLSDLGTGMAPFVGSTIYTA